MLFTFTLGLRSGFSVRPYSNGSGPGKPSPRWACTPVQVYEDASAARLSIVSDYRGQTVIYQWFNKVTGESYVGSTKNLGSRMSKYFHPPLLGNSLVYLNLAVYGQTNFSFAILEVLGPSSTVTKEVRLAREQVHLNWIFATYGNLCLNILTLAGSSEGFKHSQVTREYLRSIRLGFSLSVETRAKLSQLFSGSLNPFFGKGHSAETLSAMSAKKQGSLNPMFGQAKSPAFLANQLSSSKLGSLNPNFKPVYVWNVALDRQEGPYGSKEILRQYKISGPKFYAALRGGSSYNGYYFSRNPFTSRPVV